LPLADLLRLSVYSRLAVYEDVNDAQQLSQDPTLRLIGSEKIWERGAALTSRFQPFETELLGRRLVLPKRIDGWSLTSLQQRLVKTGGRLVRHACYYWLLLAEGHLSRRLLGSMLRPITALPLPDG